MQKLRKWQYFFLIPLFLILDLEFFFRILFLNTPFLENRFINNDSWWRLRWIKNRRYDEKDVANYFSIYRYDKVLGWNTRSNLKNHDIGKGAYLSTNSKSIRGNKEYSENKRDGITRIVTIGDSFTFGEEVSDNETYSAFLESSKENIEVLNMGVGGYGHDQMLLKLKSEGLKYNPDIVILGFLDMDMERNVISFRDYSKPSYVLNKKGLVIKNSEIPTVSELLFEEYFRWKIIDFGSLLASRYMEKQSAAEIKKITSSILDEISKTVLNINSKMLFVYLPVFGEVLHDDIFPGEEFFKEYCHQVIKKNEDNVNCLNLRLAFREASKNGEKFRGGQKEGHYDAKAHALIASNINKFLHKN